MDSNGFELLSRKVYFDDTMPVSASFYPVTTMISAADENLTRALTIRNDRPQAGSVHYGDGGVKLLIDRRSVTIDDGGIPQPMK